MHPDFHAAWLRLCDGEELDGVAQLAGVAEVPGGEAVDPLPEHLRRVNPRMEGEGGEDGQLVGGVKSGNVFGRIRLGVAKLLSPIQRVASVRAFVGHAGEDEVGGAVDDGVDGVDLVAEQVFRQRADDGNGAADGSFEAETQPLFVGQVQQLRPLLGNEVFVGGDHVLCRGSRPAGRTPPPAVRRR